MYRCQSKWENVHCISSGVERVIQKYDAALVGAQLKFICSTYYICDECWEEVRPHFLRMNGYPEKLCK